MDIKSWNYIKNLINGFFIAIIIIVLYSITDYIYFNNQLLLNDYIDLIKEYVIAISIILYIFMLYLYYKNIKNKRIINLVLIALPYFLVLLISDILSINIPRLIDYVFIFSGILIVYLKFKENSLVYKLKYILMVFLIFTFFSYPLIFENISFAYYKSKEEKLQVKGDFDFTIKDRLGNKTKLSEFKSKTVCIDMWSSTCGSCIRSMPEFEKLNIYYKNNQQYKIISLFCPMKEHETYEWFLEYIKKDFNFNIDYYYITRDEFKKLGIYRFPEFLLLNKNNKIVYRGMITYKESTNDNIYEMLEKINLNE